LLNHFSVEWFAKLDTQTTRNVSAVKKLITLFSYLKETKKLSSEKDSKVISELQSFHEKSKRRLQDKNDELEKKIRNLVSTSLSRKITNFSYCLSYLLEMVAGFVIVAC
jgi:hypothetical protein